LRNRLQYFAASFARRQFRILRKLRNLCKESDGNFSLEPVIEQLRFVRTFLAPLVVSSSPAIIIAKPLLFVLGKVPIHTLSHEIMFRWQTQRLAAIPNISRPRI